MLDRALDLALQRPRRVIDRDGEPGLAERVRDLRAIREVVRLPGHDVDVSLWLLCHGHPLLPQRVVEDLDAAGDAGPAQVGSAHPAHQTVVAAARRDRDVAGLPVLGIGQHELRHRPRVVIESAHQGRDDLVRDAEACEPILHLGEMFLVLLAEDVRQLRRAGDDLAVLRLLRVEDAEHIRVEAPLRLRTQRVAVLPEIVAERGLELGLARLVADGVDLELESGEADLREQTVREVDDLDVGRGLGRAVTLEAPLPELTEAQELRPLTAEHRLPVEEADRLR